MRSKCKPIAFFSIALMIVFLSCHVKVAIPLVWDIESIDAMRRNITEDDEAQKIIQRADNYCNMEPLAVVGNKVLHFAPNEHYFCSMGPYRWPDPDNPGKYIARDGVVNPNRLKYDSQKLTDLVIRCKYLSQAFYLTKSEKYYTAFLNQMQAWFINEDTYMYPNFEYAQVIPGHNDNKGTSTGMIDAYPFNTVIESIRLLDFTKRIDQHTMRELRSWFRDFANWAEDNYGKFMREKGMQNISVAYDVTMINMYLFAGDTKKAKRIADEFADRRIYKQIMEDGSMPGELSRTNAFSYSVYNLTHIIDFCYLVRYWDKQYYSKHGERIDRAFNFLQKYIDEPDSFPYQQISGWKNEKRDLNLQLQRREKLICMTNM